MWTLSGFVDEISPDFAEQCRVAAGLGLRYVELRSAWDVNILDLKPAQLTVLKDTLAQLGLLRRAVHPELLVLPASRRGSGRLPRCGDRPDARADPGGGGGGRHPAARE